MWYINAEPTENGSYGNPQSNRREGTLALPEELLGPYLDTMGFATLTVEDKPLPDGTSWPTVTAVEVNQAAYDAYQADHQSAPEEPQPTEQDRLEAQAMYTALMTDTLLDEEG